MTLSTPSSVPPAEVDLTGQEEQDIENRQRPRAAVLHETIRHEGEHELHRPASALFWSGLAAGLSMGFSLVTMAVIRAALPNTRWAELVSHVGYSLGFVIVIMGRQQLFTENTLTPVLPLLHNRDRKTLVRLLRLWGVVLAANVAGAALFGVVLARSAVLPDEVKVRCVEIGRAALAGSAGVHFLRAIFSGWLVALVVWLLPGAESSRVTIIVAITYLIGAAGLSHVVAGSVDGVYAVAAGAASWQSLVFGFFFPVLAGNVLGGTSLVAALAHAQIIAERRRATNEV